MSKPRKGHWSTRFRRVDRGYVTPCCEWTGARDGGYGIVRVLGRRWRVHRLVWATAYGDPGTLDVLHHCDNPSCGRLDHLFTGTAADNMADARAKARTTQGERHANARLTEVEITAIRSSTEPGVVLAARFGVCKQHISDIRKGTKWAHLP